MNAMLAEAPALGLVVMDVYARRSFGKDGDMIHEDEQAEECIERIDETPGWVLGKVFKDHALSAWAEDVIRPDFEDLMRRAESGVSGGILVWDLNRFTRKPEEGERLLKQASRGIVIADLAMEYNVRSATGRKVFRDKVNAGAYESDTISERSSRGKRLKAKRGRTNASHRAFGSPGYLPNPPGWEQGDTRTPVPEEQLAREIEAIREAARLVIAGERLTTIARMWNAAGHRTYSGGLWNNDSLRTTLRRPSVAGLVEYKGKIIGTSSDPAPLDEATWQQVKAVFESRRAGRPAKQYLLSGLVTCELCGAKLYGRPRYSKGMGDHRQYWCQLRMATTGSKRSGCGRLVIEQSFADNLVEALVVKRLGNPKSAARLAQVAKQIREEVQVLRAELDRLNEEVDALMSKTNSTPLWTPARVESAVAKYEDPIADVAERLAKAEEALPDSGAETALVDAQAEWDAADFEQKRRLIKRAFPEGLVVRKSESRGRAALTKGRIVPAETLAR